MSGPYFESGYIDANYFDDPVSATLTATFTIQCEPVDPYFEAGYFEQGYFVGDAPSGTTQEASASFTDTFSITANISRILTPTGIELVISNNVINISITVLKSLSSTLDATFTHITNINKIIQSSVTLSDSVTLSNTITRVRTIDVTVNNTFTQSAQITLFKGYEASIASEVNTQSQVGAIRQGSIQMTGAFTPTLTASAIRNSTAILDSSANLQFTISKFTGNEGTLESIVNLSLQNNAIFVGNSGFNSSSVGGDQSDQSAQFTLSITADKIKEAEIQINSPYYEDGYLVDDYYENAGFDLSCDFDRVKVAQIEMDSPYYEDGYIDEDYFISKGFTLSVDITKLLSGTADISSNVTLSTNAQRLRSVDASTTTQFTQSTQINRTRSFASTFTSEFTQSASVNEIQDFTSTPSSQFGITLSTDRIRSDSATIESQATLACEFSEIETFEIDTSAQFTQTTQIEVIRGYQANLTNQVNQTADVSRSRDFDSTLSAQFTQSTSIERFGGVSADLQSQASLNAEIGTLETAQITMSGVFTPVLTVNALRNMTAILDVVANIQTEVNVITENQIQAQTEFTQTTQGDRIRFINASFTASISVTQQQIETITPFEAQLNVQAQLQQQQVERTVQVAANINSEAQITYNTIELITPVEADIQAQFTQSTQGDRIRFIDDTLSAQFTFIPVIGNLQQGSAQLSDAFSPTMTINVVRDVLSEMANSVVTQITAQKITDIDSTFNSQFTQSTSETLFKSFGSDPVAVATLTVDTGIVFEVDFLSQSITFNSDLSANVTDGASGFVTTFTMAPVKPNTARPSTIFTAEGNAELDTANKKFGTSSLLLSGTGDQVVTGPNYSNKYVLAPGNWPTGDDEDFQIDFWFKPDWSYFNGSNITALGQTYQLVNVRGGIQIYLQSVGASEAVQQNTLYLSVYKPGSLDNMWRHQFYTTDADANGWYHVALTANGSTNASNQVTYLYRLYLNGGAVRPTPVSSYTTFVYGHFNRSNPIAPDVNGKISIDLGTPSFVTSHQYRGYIEEFKLRSNTTIPFTYLPEFNFPVPTTAYGVDEDTPILLHFDGTDGSTDIVDDGGFRTEFAATPSAQFDLTAEGIKVRIFEADFDVVASQLTAAVKTADFVTVPDTQFTMSVDADYTVDNTAQLTSQATQTATVTRIKTLESTQTSETNVTAQVVKTVSAQSTEIVEFTQTAQAIKTVSAQAQIQDAMSFGITAFLVRDTEQNLIVQATMAVTGARIRFADSTQTSQSTLTADVNSIGFAEADLSVTAELTIEYTKIPEIQITAVSVASVNLTAGIERIRPFSAQISDAMSFQTVATANLVGVTSMDTQASMSVDANRIRNTGGSFVIETTQNTIVTKKIDINSTLNINTSLSVIAFELQVFDLIYTIPNESRINTVESEQRLYTIRDENRLYTIEGE